MSLYRFDFSEKNKNEATKEEEEKRRAQVCTIISILLYFFDCVYVLC